MSEWTEKNPIEPKRARRELHSPHPLAVRMEEPMSDERLAKIRAHFAVHREPQADELLAEVERTRSAAFPQEDSR